MANEAIITSRTFSLGEVDSIEARKKHYNAIVSILNSSKRVDLGGISVTSDIADDFSPESTYSAGDFVFHEGELYRAKEANGPGNLSPHPGKRAISPRMLCSVILHRVAWAKILI